MSTSKEFLIAFHENNRNKALAFQRELSQAGCSFELLSSADVREAGEFNQRLLASNKHILLFVSDNLLKEALCMYGGLEAIQQLSSANRLLPLVIDGEYPRAGGATEQVTTVFERVGDVIQYLNYWQDEYINLRQKRRHMEEDENLEAINESLRVVRQVSSEIGEYLRHLRVVKHYTWEQLSQNDWELFFKLIQYPQGHSQLKEFLANPIPEPDTPMAQAPVEAPMQPEEILLGEPPVAEGEDEEIPEEALEELPPTIEWTELPGISSLGGAPSEAPEFPEQEEEPDSVSSLIRKLVEHAGENQETPPPPPVSEEAPSDASKPPAPEPLVHPTEELEKVEDLFEEAAFEEESEEEAEEKAELRVEEPEEAEAIVEEAEHQFASNQFVAGLNLLSQAIEDFPNSVQLRFHYAQSLVKYAQNPREASLELEKLVRLDPGYVPAWFLLGELAEMGKQYRQARQYFEHAVYLDPDLDQGYFRLGKLLSTQFEGEDKQAARYFRKACKVNEEHADALYEYGTLLYERLDQAKKAVKAFRKLLKLRPDHPFANYDLALIYHARGDMEKANKYYLRAVENNPELQTQENDEAFYFEPEAVSEEKEEKAGPREVAESVNEIDSPEDSAGIVLITGATSGIGQATAVAFAKAGYSLILTGRREERLEVLQQKLRSKYGVPVRILCFDVRDQEEVNEHLHELDEAWCNIDILVNNAGLAKGLAPIHEGDLNHWETMIETNIKGLLYVTRVVTPWMVRRKSGHIINIGSIAGKEAYPSGNVYCASKFAIDGLTKAMRLDLYQHGIRVSQICPGHVEETEFALVRFDGDAERARIYEDFKPLHSSDIADLILYIAQAPPHVNILDVVVTSAQQASATHIDRSGRDRKK